MSPIDRRTFLSRITVALSVFIAGLVGVPILGNLLAPLFRAPPDGFVEVAKVADFALGVTKLVSIRDQSPLAWAGQTADTGWGPWNFVESLGAALLAVSMLVFAANLVRSIRAGAIAGDDPWDGFTLEWATTSPPPPENFRSLPAVTGRRPLWDAKHPDRRDAA